MGDEAWKAQIESAISNIQSHSAQSDSQIKLINEWTGHYSVVWNLEMILKELGIK